MIDIDYVLENFRVASASDCCLHLFTVMYGMFPGTTLSFLSSIESGGLSASVTTFGKVLDPLETSRTKLQSMDWYDETALYKRRCQVFPLLTLCRKF